mmetsp:Transcript_35127/g.91161  ORF Transcript_35127/g.91161 Transcript_35127/m.91161 type:complete len:210 (-) Transcript_35127:97-726(-)
MKVPSTLLLALIRCQLRSPPLHSLLATSPTSTSTRSLLLLSRVVPIRIGVVGVGQHALREEGVVVVATLIPHPARTVHGDQPPLPTRRVVVEHAHEVAVFVIRPSTCILLLARMNMAVVKSVRICADHPPAFLLRIAPHLKAVRRVLVRIYLWRGLQVAPSQAGALVLRLGGVKKGALRFFFSPSLPSISPSRHVGRGSERGKGTLHRG